LAGQNRDLALSLFAEAEALTASLGVTGESELGQLSARVSAALG
jgi:hypothetical protein